MINEQVQLGEFVLDVKQQLLLKQNNEVSAEPKSIELLTYLLNNRERYVKLDELHTHVWQGRIVSDTAVRNTIKKLRNVLGDTDLSDSRYIKSVPKRGYKLVCEVTSLLSENIPSEQSPAVSDDNSDNVKSDKAQQSPLEPFVVYEDKQAVDQILNTSGGYSQTMEMPASPIWSTPLFKSLAALFVVVFAAVTYMSVADSDGAEPKVEVSDNQVNPLNLEILSNFPGEKTGIASSKNGKLIAFTGRPTIDQENQVYLFDTTTAEIKQLTHHARYATDLIFANDDTALIYNDTVYGDMSLNLIDLTNVERSPRKLLGGQTIIGRMAEGISPDTLVFPLKSTIDTAMMIYQLDIKTGKLSRLLTSANTEQVDYMIAVSRNKSLLAVARRQGKKEVISIKKTEDLQEVQFLSLERRLINILWKDPRTLVLMDSHALWEMDIYSGEKRLLTPGMKDLIQNVSMDAQGVISLLKNASVFADRFFVESDLTMDSSSGSRIYEVDSTVWTMAYLDEFSNFLVTRRIEGVYDLYTYNPASRSMKSLLPDIGASSMQILDVANQHPSALVSLDGRLAVVNTSTAELVYLTNSEQVVSDAVFTPDETSVVFGEKVAGKWGLYRKSLTAGSLPEPFLDRFKTLRFWRHGIVVSDGSGNLYQLDDQFGSPRLLEHQIDSAPMTRWYVEGTTLIWTTLDFQFTYFHTFDLESKQYKVQKEKYSKLHPTLFINKMGTKVLYRYEKAHQTSIQQVNDNDGDTNGDN